MPSTGCTFLLRFGFKNFYSAQKTLAGIEPMKMIKKWQIIGGDGLSPAGQFY
ncbi:transposase, IS6 family [Bathymodiolus platifrons methanotrophic gill symbiont]|uniref:transposase n=1 Tax=Bathymodiolus platifrons methanotrophic gill symbiont TaxID=113268 RepID=UPI001B659F80|nr:transposase, IS6 family [Bathymodiolus platifrons methanotrophic gill symbiont]